MHLRAKGWAVSAPRLCFFRASAGQKLGLNGFLDNSGHIYFYLCRTWLWFCSLVMPFSLPTADEKADYVLNQFNRIARRYDLANDAISLGMHRLWKEAAIRTLDLKIDGRYLDVCCGTGDLTLRIADK